MINMLKWRPVPPESGRGGQRLGKACPTSPEPQLGQICQAGHKAYLTIYQRTSMKENRHWDMYILWL